MKWHKKILSLELKNKSALGFGILTKQQLRRLLLFINKSDNLNNLDALSAVELNQLAELLETARPLSARARQLLAKFDRMSEFEQSAFADQLERGRGKIDFRTEVEREFMRRAV